jgi:hypothetical protein
MPLRYYSSTHFSLTQGQSTLRKHFSFFSRWTSPISSNLFKWWIRRLLSFEIALRGSLRLAEPILLTCPRGVEYFSCRVGAGCLPGDITGRGLACVFINVASRALLKRDTEGTPTIRRDAADGIRTRDLQISQIMAPGILHENPMSLAP